MISDDLQKLYVLLLKNKWHVYACAPGLDNERYHVCFSEKYKSYIGECVNLIPMEPK